MKVFQRMFRGLVIVGLALVPWFAAAPAALASGITTANDKATLQFPDSIAFSIDLASTAPIKEVVLEYGVDELACGSTVAKAFPEFEPATSVKAAWTWKMELSGSLPPGTRVHWQWQITDAAGSTLITRQKTITWLDPQYPWQTVSGQQINLHWYNGDPDFGRRLHLSAVRALAVISQTLGLQIDSPIDLYIYASNQAMREAVLFEPDWAGGLAYPRSNIIIIGVAPAEEAWGRSVEAHEITHILVGQYAFSCMSTRSTWLDEGLAMVVEGGLTPGEKRRLENARRSDSLISLRNLDQSLFADEYTVELAYSESYSLVDFLITDYGSADMLALVRALHGGASLDSALDSVYGFDAGGLENAWRAKIHAKPAPAPAPTALPALALGAATPKPECAREGEAKAASLALPTAAPDRPLSPAATPTAVGGGAASMPPTVTTAAAAVRRTDAAQLPGGGLLMALTGGLAGLGLVSARRARRRE
jgi:hypothetical protein